MTIHIQLIESHPTRYTSEWRESVPHVLGEHFDVRVYEGHSQPTTDLGGQFLDWPGTSHYKATQFASLVDAWRTGAVREGDYVLWLDAWNPQILQTRYLSELTGIRVSQGGLWHAGSYDPHDIITRTCSQTEFLTLTERAIYASLDHNFFATQSHIDLWNRTHSDTAMINALSDRTRTHRVGWPLEYIYKAASHYQHQPFRTIVSPHRLSAEKQPEIFRDLAEQLPEYTWVEAQAQQRTKREYHELLSTSRMVFSANLQETLGIGVIEASIFGCRVMVPNRLCYPEMYPEQDLYPSEWTESWQSYQQHRPQLIERIRAVMEAPHNAPLKTQRLQGLGDYITSRELIQHISDLHRDPSRRT